MPDWMTDDASHYFGLSLSKAEEYVIDVGDGFQAMHNTLGEDRKLGPMRKREQTALKDIHRDIDRRIAQLLQARKAKLP